MEEALIMNPNKCMEKRVGESRKLLFEELGIQNRNIGKSLGESPGELFQKRLLLGIPKRNHMEDRGKVQ